MIIEKIHIKNFKCFRGDFILSLNQGINILVGNNEAGKSTILEAINLALTGLFQGKSVKHDLSQYMFNNSVLEEYISSLSTNEKQRPPEILIEIYFQKEAYPQFMGNGNSKQENACGISLRIGFNEDFNAEYENLIVQGLDTLPLEYYEVKWLSFARNYIIPRNIPLRCSFIDSSNSKTKNNSDIFLSRIIKNVLEENDIIAITQAFRQLQENFKGHETISSINDKMTACCDLSKKNVQIGVDLSSRSAWEDYITTYLDYVPFSYVGKGEQVMIKTLLALTKEVSSDKESIILIEEPENHLSYSNLNDLLLSINTHCGNKQVIITTHSSYVANKLGLSHLILLANHKCLSLEELTEETVRYFRKLPGFDTLRMVLCKSSILVEGASDELIVQKAYMKLHNNRLPIQDGIDVISVNNLSFLKFLEIAHLLELKSVVVTDNDGNIDALNKKYANYISSSSIRIVYEENIDRRTEINGESFNFNTLEPIVLKSNSLQILNKIFKKSYKREEELLLFMKKNKVECALKIFDYDDSDFTFPDYINKAVKIYDEKESK